MAANIHSWKQMDVWCFSNSNCDWSIGMVNINLSIAGDWITLRPLDTRMVLVHSLRRCCFRVAIVRMTRRMIYMGRGHRWRWWSKSCKLSFISLLSFWCRSTCGAFVNHLLSFSWIFNLCAHVLIPWTHCQGSVSILHTRLRHLMQTIVSIESSRVWRMRCCMIFISKWYFLAWDGVWTASNYARGLT